MGATAWGFERDVFAKVFEINTSLRLMWENIFLRIALKNGSFFAFEFCGRSVKHKVHVAKLSNDVRRGVGNFRNLSAKPDDTSLKTGASVMLNTLRKRLFPFITLDSCSWECKYCGSLRKRSRSSICRIFPSTA